MKWYKYFVSRDTTAVSGKIRQLLREEQVVARGVNKILLYF